MNEAQWRELQQIRGEQAALAERLARLEARLQVVEKTSDASPALPEPAIEMSTSPTAWPLPMAAPPPPSPRLPPAPPPPLPPEAFGFHKGLKKAEVPPPFTAAPPTAPSENAAAPAPARESLEVRIGTTWLVRVGVVMLLTALAFLGSYLYKNVVPHLGPAAKVGLLYLGAGALAGAGAWLERGREAAQSPRMLNFARVVLAGGLAGVYYVTYAAHWNPNLLVLHSALVDGALLIACTAYMVWLADRRGSEVLATFAILLAFYASAINEIAAFTLFSNLLLTVAAVYLLRRHLWVIFPYASLLATFGSYGFWRYYYGYQSWAHPAQPGRAPTGFWIESAFLAIYWLLFTGSVFRPGVAPWSPRQRAGFATLNNAAFFVLTTWTLHYQYRGSFWMWSLGFGVALCALAETCRRVRPRVDAETEGAYLFQGIVLVSLGFFAYLDGWQLSLVLAAQSVVLLLRAQAREERLPLWASLASAAAAFMVTANGLGDWNIAVPWLSAFGAGALLVFNAWSSQRQSVKLPMATAPKSSAWPGFQTILTAAPAYFSALGLAVWLWTLERTLVHEAALVPVLAAAAAVLTAMVYILRVRVIPFYALAFLAAAYAHRFAADDLASTSRHDLPAGSTVGLLMITLAIGHWWERRWPGIGDSAKPSNEVGVSIAGFIAALFVGLIYDWLRPGVATGPSTAVWAAENAVVSLALLAYGLRTRYRTLAAIGQTLLAASVTGCMVGVWSHDRPGGFSGEMLLTLVPLAVLLATIFVGRRYAVRARAVNPLAAYALIVYEAAATLFFLAWVCRYVPAEARFTVFAVAGAAICVWALVQHVPRWLVWGGLLTWVGAIALAILSRGDRAAFVHLLGIAAVAGQQQFARFWMTRDPAAAPAAPPRWQGVWMTVATLCAWAVLNARMALVMDRAFTLAAAWSLFAALVFTAGLLLREKVYRWLGLAILVCTLGRIAIVDIWQFDSLGRALSALCLGIVLLGIGYLYNRFHTRWHGFF